MKEELKKGALYVIATPIGNLSEITNRAVNILSKVDLIACEDTRQTLKLLNALEIKKKLISYHRHNEEDRKDNLIEQLKQGNTIALVSDAGMPGICDPGKVLINEAIENSIDVIPISGPTSFVNALVGSGLDTSEFTFLGFLPQNKKNRKEKLDEIRKSNKTTIIFEAPHKLKQTIKDLQENLDEETNIVIARELTKIHEQFIRCKVKDVDNLTQDIKGEMVLLIEANKNVEQQENQLDNLSNLELYNIFEKEGLDKKEIIKKIAKLRNVSKNEIYQEFLDK